ncbi:hypothetical protein G4B11_007657 [Aspergillus flavus]|nr:hypothetical protein G4B11_007657 [Aspergillus flavus]
MAKAILKDTGFTVLHEGHSNPELDIVFVHGLQGHPEKTWTSFSQPLRDKPESLLSKHEYCVNSRIMTYGYDSNIIQFVKTANFSTISGEGESSKTDAAYYFGLLDEIDGELTLQGTLKECWPTDEVPWRDDPTT